MGLPGVKFGGNGNGRCRACTARVLGIAVVLACIITNYQSTTFITITSRSGTTNTILNDTVMVMIKPAQATGKKSDVVEFRRDDYKYCQITPEPQIDQHRIRMEQVPPAMDLWYQCSGQPYNDYMDSVWAQVIHAKHHADPTSPWGKRPFPIPPGKTILVMGNSHTPQVLTSLLCQHRDQIINAAELAPVPGKKNVAMTFFLRHNVIIHVLVNHPFVYSKRWHRTLALEFLKMPLFKLDAIVLGSFNALKESYKTSFQEVTLRYQKEMPHHRVNFLQQEAPLMQDVAQVYGGPLIWISMFAKYSQPYHEKAMTMISNLQFQNGTRRDRSVVVVDTRPIHQHHLDKRNNLRAIYGRRYIDSHLHGMECSSDSYDIVSTCLTNRTSNKRYSDGHKCVGQHGGFPDLIAWDLIEALYDVLA
jgi:hypothetical protein